jgi:hypothetical protein
VTQPVAPVGEPAPPAPSEPSGPDDATVPVEPVPEAEPQEKEARPPAGGTAKRRRRPRSADHDPSIIPGLADDEHDDEIGRTGP